MEKNFLRFVWPWLSHIIRFAIIPFSSALKKHLEFELKNLNENYLSKRKTADICFEISSEGEFEQIVPLIREAIQLGKIIEIIYCSPSVEHQVKKIESEYEDRVSSIRLPLLSLNSKHNISNWITANTLVLCRYDFFPELIKIGREEGRKFVLVSGSLKGKEKYLDGLTFWGLYLKRVFLSFDLIFASSELDSERFEKFIGIEKSKIKIADFRVPQILNRLLEAEKKLSTLSYFSNLKKHLLQFTKEKRIILGSYWEHDKELFTDVNLQSQIKSGEVLIGIAPHDLSQDNLRRIFLDLGDFELDYIVLSSGQKFSEDDISNKVLIFSDKGILCELYSYFGQAYIGGGFGKSVHSVLEPHLSGALVYCGPKTGRSTEVDYIRGVEAKSFKNQLFVLDNPVDFFATMQRNISEVHEFKDLRLSLKREQALISSALLEMQC